MKTPAYIRVLDRGSRRTALSVGMAIKSASMTKDATIIDEATDLGTKGLLTFSLVTGIPIGIAAHMISAKMKARSRRERETQAKIDYYRNAGRALDVEMMNQGVQP